MQVGTPRDLLTYTNGRAGGQKLPRAPPAHSGGGRVNVKSWSLQSLPSGRTVPPCIAIILCLDRNIALGGDLQQVLERAFDMNNRSGPSRSEKFKLLDQ